MDAMMVSKCIERIEKEITDGRLASRFIPVPELKESQALMLYKESPSCRHNDGRIRFRKLCPFK